MKTSCRAAAALFAAGFGACTAENSVVTSQETISVFDAKEFVFKVGLLPALEGQGISMTLINLDACTTNVPPLHPGATEMLYMIDGGLTSAFVEENGREGAVINDLSKGDMAFFPQGLIHYQQNIGCSPATFVAVRNTVDSGAATVTAQSFELPSEDTQASLNLDDPQLQALLSALPQSPAMARHECLQRCGLQINSRSLISGSHNHGSSHSSSSHSSSSDSSSSDSSSSDSSSSDSSSSDSSSSDSSSSDSSSSDSSSDDSSSDDSSSTDGKKHLRA